MKKPAAKKAKIGRPFVTQPDVLEFACKTYRTKERMVRRWVQIGGDNGDPCPLMDPAAMPDWFRRNMAKPVNSMMRAGIDEWVAKNAPEQPPPPMDGAGDDPAEMDFETTLKTQRRGLQQALDKLIASSSAGVTADAFIRDSKTWREIIKEYRVLEKDAPKILQAQGIVIPRVEVATKIQANQTALRAVIKGSIIVEVQKEFGATREQARKFAERVIDNAATIIQHEIV